MRTSQRRWSSRLCELTVCAVVLAVGSIARGEPKKAPAPGSAVKKNSRDDLKYVWISPGAFQMGCSAGDPECVADEKPAHQVTITKGFWMAQTEVTVGAYKRFAHAKGKQMPPEPAILGTPLNAGWKDDRQAMSNVTWGDASDYCSWAGGRLPTEAEWEYAARGGNPDGRYGPMDEIGWDADNSGNQKIDSTRIRDEDRKNFRVHLKDNACTMHDVGLKRPNGFGLFDTLGNMWEWVNDWYDANYYQNSPAQDPTGPASGQNRILRGGSWDDFPAYVRVSYRYGRSKPDHINESVGFRCAMDKLGR